MVTVQNLLDQASQINTTIQQIRDALKANPVASQAQLQQISDAQGVAVANANNLKSDLGIS